MDPTRNLAQAAGAWLQYEFACGRSTLFNERYLSVPIANALYFLYKDEVRSEYLHPVLAPAARGPGRRPEVDFALVNNYPNVSCVLESKWVGRNGLTAEDVLWDLLRLELIAHHAQAPAFFLMGGRRSHIENFFKSKAFLGEPTRQGKYSRLLKLDNRRNPRIRVDNPAGGRRPVFEKLLRPYQEISFSSRITTSICQSYPRDCPMFQYQVYVWQVLAPAGTSRFLPKNHSYYRQQND
jgi:hypothetical protein